MPAETFRAWTRRIKNDYIIPVIAFFSIMMFVHLLTFTLIDAPNMILDLHTRYIYSSGYDYGFVQLLQAFINRIFFETSSNFGLDLQSLLFAIISVSSPQWIVNIHIIALLAFCYLVFFGFLVRCFIQLVFAVIGLGLIMLDLVLIFSMSIYTWLFMTDSNTAQRTNKHPMDHLHLTMICLAGFVLDLFCIFPIPAFTFWLTRTDSDKPQRMIEYALHHRDLAALKATCGIVTAFKAIGKVAPIIPITAPFSFKHGEQNDDTKPDTAALTPSSSSSSLSTMSRKQPDFVFTANHDDGHTIFDEISNGSATTSLLGGPKTGDKRPADMEKDEDIVASEHQECNGEVAGSPKKHRRTSSISSFPDEDVNEEEILAGENQGCDDEVNAGLQGRQRAFSLPSDLPGGNIEDEEVVIGENEGCDGEVHAGPEGRQRASSLPSCFPYGIVKREGVIAGENEGCDGEVYAVPKGYQRASSSPSNLTGETVVNEEGILEDLGLLFDMD